MKLKRIYLYLLTLSLVIFIKQYISLVAFPNKQLSATPFINLFNNPVLLVTIASLFTIISTMLTAYIWYFAAHLICSIASTFLPNAPLFNSSPLKESIIKGVYAGTAIYNVYILIFYILKFNMNATFIMISSLLSTLLCCLAIYFYQTQLRFAWKFSILSIVPPSIILVLPLLI